MIRVADRLPSISEIIAVCRRMKTDLCSIFGTVVDFCVCVHAHACVMSASLQPQGLCSLTFFVRWPFPYFDTVCHCALHRPLVSSGTCSPQAHRNASWNFLDSPTKMFEVEWCKHIKPVVLSSFCAWNLCSVWCFMWKKYFVALGEQVSPYCSKGPKRWFMTKRELMSVHTRLSGTHCSKLERGLSGLGCHLLEIMAAVAEFRDFFIYSVHIV